MSNRNSCHWCFVLRGDSPTGAGRPVSRGKLIHSDSPIPAFTPLYPCAKKAVGQGDHGVPGDTMTVILSSSGVTVRVIDSDTRITDPVILAWLKQQPPVA